MIEPLDPRTRLTESEAAEYLGMSVERLRKLRYAGQAPRFTRAGQKVQYRVEWLEDYLDAHVEEPRLTRTERRCALVHEHRHLAHGDTCHSEKAERRARRETALILLPELPRAHDDLTPHQVAAEHDVTLTVLTDRLLIERGEL